MMPEQNERQRILVMDDEDMIRKALKRFLEDEGYEVIVAKDGREGIETFEKTEVDLSLVDLMMPEMTGQEVIEAMRQKDPDALAIIMTAFGTIPSAVNAIRSGAYHYVTKPFELDDIGSLVQKALEFRRLKKENKALRRQLDQRRRSRRMIGESPQIRNVFNMIEKVAETDSTVLILGESGTGKELIAREIHEQSARRAKPLIAVNCAAMPEGLLESEFFGHVKGAFTGASSNREGCFAQADGGTIFLDEIADMSLKLQVKILRVLQERQFQPIGSSQVREVNVRIITATNRDLDAMVKEGTFREDLYYRLNVIPIDVPALRERRQDIPLLVDLFLDRFSKENDCESPQLSAAARRRLLDYAWPGNVRELENMVERLVVLNPGREIDAEDLPDVLCGESLSASGISCEVPDEGLSFKSVVSHFERGLLLSALKKTQWNKNQAAQLLGLNRTTLIEKIKKQQLEPLDS